MVTPFSLEKKKKPKCKNIILLHQWPPVAIETVNGFELPFLKTVLLLAYGVNITYLHHYLTQGGHFYL